MQVIMPPPSKLILTCTSMIIFLLSWQSLGSLFTDGVPSDFFLEDRWHERNHGKLISLVAQLVANLLSMKFKLFRQKFGKVFHQKAPWWNLSFGCCLFSEPKLINEVQTNAIERVSWKLISSNFWHALKRLSVSSEYQVNKLAGDQNVNQFNRTHSQILLRSLRTHFIQDVKIFHSRLEHDKEDDSASVTLNLSSTLGEMFQEESNQFVGTPNQFYLNSIFAE